MKTIMEYKGFKAEIREAPRLIGDHVFELPKGTPLPVYFADEFINYPENWMKGQGVFVVPVKPNKGLWFNWRGNDELNTAVLPTVKGANPITGMQTSGFHLEAYESKCPKHGCDFMADRFCPECDFKWPDRNYCSQAPLWWDGHRAGNFVRQFFFTEEELRDVATHMIGKENTVPAFGFAFYTPKERREHPTLEVTRGMSGSIFHTSTPGIGCLSKKGITNDSYVTANNDVNIYNTSLGSYGDGGLESAPEPGLKLCSDGGPISAPVPCAASAFVEDSADDGEQTSGGIIVPDNALFEAPKSKGLQERLRSYKTKKISKEPRGLQVNSTSRPTPRPKSVKEVSIGAGAKIRQELNHDPYPLDSWKEVPDASMTIYFVFEEKLEELKSKGMRDVTGTPEGMLKNIPVG